MKFAVAACGIALALMAPVASAKELCVRPPIVAEGADWVGYAAAPSGRVFKVNDADEETTARSLARAECERTTGRTCNAIAVPSDWPVAVVTCEGRASFVGGSSLDNARDVANLKAERAGFYGRQCMQVYPR